MPTDASKFWPLDRTAEALDALLLRSGIALPPGATFSAFIREGGDLDWLTRLPQGLGCETRLSILPTVSLLDRLAIQRGPCLVCDPASETTLAVVFDSPTRARLVLPDGSDERVDREAILDLVLSTRSQAGLEALFAGLPDADRAVRALSSAEFDLNRSTLIAFGPDAAHPMRDQLNYERAFRPFATHLALVGLQWFVSLGALWTLGSSIADGHIDGGRIAAWTALSLTSTPLMYLASRALRGFAIPLGARMKRRILEGAFKVEERQIRSQGYGSLLGRVNEASIVERIDLIDIFGVVTSVGQIFIGALLFQHSSLFLPLLGVLLGSVSAFGLLARSLLRSYKATFRLRLRLTDDLVDKLLGHRTRALQQPARQYHVGEDADLVAYGKSAKNTDDLQALAAMFPRLWLMTAGSILVAAFLLTESPSSLAWAGIGLLLIYQACGALSQALQSVATWWTAYDGIRPLIEAGRARDKAPRRADVEVGDRAVPVVVSATSLSFAYRAGALPILSEASFRVHRGEKVLVRGPSGGGKTTLFKLIGGELRPAGGAVLVSGTDAHLVSDEEWRERVASAPQFHENYVFGQPVAFNLDPRGRFAEPSDEARAICTELGLDGVIGRMPQGYAQLLGETGWQLSHGERSRIFIARALLQHADVFLFDESFGALDPETQLRALECARRRAKTLMVIAHV